MIKSLLPGIDSVITIRSLLYGMDLLISIVFAGVFNCVFYF